MFQSCLTFDWHNFATRKTPTEVSTKQKVRFNNNLLPGHYCKSRWWRSSGVWHFDLHLPALKAAEVKPVWKVPEPNNKITDLTNTVIVWRLRVNLFLQFVPRKYRLHGIFIDVKKPGLLSTGWIDSFVTGYVIAGKPGGGGFRHETRMSCRHKRRLRMPLKIFIHFKVRSSDKSFVVLTPEDDQYAVTFVLLPVDCTIVEASWFKFKICNSSSRKINVTDKIFNLQISSFKSISCYAY